VRVGVLGLGLIGGSVALAAAAARCSGRRLRSRSRGGRRALARGAIDELAPDVAAAVAGADIVWVAAPVGALPAAVSAALDAAGPGTAVTDVGSTKRRIVGAVEDQRFVGGHPPPAPRRPGSTTRAPTCRRRHLVPDADRPHLGHPLERLHRAIVGLGRSRRRSTPPATTRSSPPSPICRT